MRPYESCDIALFDAAFCVTRHFKAVLVAEDLDFPWLKVSLVCFAFAAFA